MQKPIIPQSQGVPQSSAFSFVPQGYPRSIVEYIAATIPGAVLLFAFFVASESTVLFLSTGGKPNDAMLVTFLPVICLIPVLSGAVSALVLEKVRSKQLSVKRGALVGAAAGLGGTLLSSLMILALSLLGKQPFGSVITSTPLVAVALVAIICMDAVLAALGGALVVKFLKDI
jgi:hypothetical protein